ncbi:MAG: DUF1207 domain-containing protein [Ignavibacteriaceae bacterium]|jgi:hypothetical protein|nr:DUF1207 domain-containing protein [Ignavibacteriaceae bacterium]
MKKIKFISLNILLLGSILFSQQRATLFPAELNIKPFVANFLEPKVGFMFMLGKNSLRLDIGNSKDFFHYADGEKTYSFGGDFFTYTKLRGEKDFHFPVDAVDYLFGLNGGIKIKNTNYECGMRMRLSHISAHFVDGHFDKLSGSWRNGRTPRVYSREFVEVTPFYSMNDFRLYFGYAYLFHVVPKEIGKNVFQIGGEKFFDLPFANYFFPFITYDLRVTKLGKYSGTNSLSAGVKVGNKNTGGFSFMINYFSGNSVHGEYFDYKEKYISFGMNIDL